MLHRIQILPLLFLTSRVKTIMMRADGSLVLETAAGEVRWAKPVAYQKGANGLTAAFPATPARISPRMAGTMMHL